MKVSLFIISILLAFFYANCAFAAYSGDTQSAMVGVPFGVSDEVDKKLCPAGLKVIESFLVCWSEGNYEAMYSLYDEKSKEGYPLKQARLDFSVLEYKPYVVSAIRKRSDGNFEFMLSYGTWQDGNKDNKKMIIDGRSFKIIRPSPNSPFKVSAADYF